jgi:hypothetical protein
MEVTENFKLQDRRHLLIRGLQNGNISQEKYDEEIPELERKIKENLAKRLAQLADELKDDLKRVKKEINTDGDLKRAVAKILKQFLQTEFSDDDIRGIFRQGYKMMRGN